MAMLRGEGGGRGEGGIFFLHSEVLSAWKKRGRDVGGRSDHYEEAMLSLRSVGWTGRPSPRTRVRASCEGNVGPQPCAALVMQCSRCADPGCVAR